MTTQLQLRRGTDAENNAFTGAEGEVTVDTTNKTLRVHDGVTQGGFAVAHKSDTAKNDMSNLTNVGKNIANWSSNVTNCITEIPQDIKIELNAGTLTLKAGSKVYVPNGVGVFDTITTASDLTITYSGSDTLLVFLRKDGTGLSFGSISSCVSGSTDSLEGTTYHNWYDTTNNVIHRYTSNASTPNHDCSLPLCIVTSFAGAITSIDQVFNGFGYIGSTVFALPGVKCLLPYGKKEDGTQKNNSLTINSVITRTNMGASLDAYTAALNSTPSIQYNSNYHIEEDGFVHTSGGAIVSVCVFATYSTDSSGQITSFNPKTVFHAVDYSDTEFIAHQAMPSTRYISLTLPATGETVTAPADGYYTVSKSSTADNQYISIANNTSGLNVSEFIPNGAGCRVFIPVSKGDVVTINYTLAGTTNWFRFIYANGAK